MNLTDEQKQAVRDWVEAGADFAVVQNKLQSEFDLSITYMETRFLLGDLDLTIKEEDNEADPDDGGPQSPAEDAEGPEPELVAEEPTADPGPAASGKASVTVDKIARPGMMVSGKVVFGDGHGASWYLDRTGQLGIDPGSADYRPSESDVRAFQTELQTVLETQGL